MSIISCLKRFLARSDIEASAKYQRLVIPPTDPDSPVQLNTDTRRFYLDPSQGELK